MGKIIRIITKLFLLPRVLEVYNGRNVGVLRRGHGHIEWGETDTELLSEMLDGVIPRLIANLSEDGTIYRRRSAKRDNRGEFAGEV